MSPDNQRLIAHVLAKAGADVMVKENGKLAADLALGVRDEGKSFDVILMDMQMPVLDGYEARGLLRRKGYTGAIMALTAHAMAGDQEKVPRRRLRRLRQQANRPEEADRDDMGAHL